MKRLAFFLLASGLFWTGCIGNDSLGTASTAQRNIENLARLSLGMTSDQVFQIMRQPYRNEVFDFGDNHYEVWFYVTNLTLLDQKKLTQANLTPLTFKNGVLQGKGYNYYEALVSQEENKTKDQKPPQEDEALEKVLTPPAGSKSTKPVNPPPSQPSQAKPKPSTSSKAKESPKSGPSQPPAPKQPTPTQGPQQTTPSKTTPPQGKVSMSKKPSSTEPPPESPKDQTTLPSKKSSKNPPPQEPENNVPLKKEDEQMIQQEQEENFNFW